MAFFFATGRSIDPAAHSRVIANLSRIQELDSELDETVLKLRSGLLHNFDPLVAALNAMRSHLLDIEQGEHAIVGRGESEIDQTTAAFSAGLAEKEALVERFKSRNALLRNSLLYFPLALEALVGDPRVPPADRSRVEALSRDILLLRLDATRTDYDGIAAAIDRFRRDTELYSQEVRLPLESVLRHAHSVLTHHEQLDRLVREITAKGSGNTGRSIAETYNRSFERKLRRADLLRFALLLASLAVMTYATYAFRRLQKSTVELEQAIAAQSREIAERERTARALRESEERLRTIADNLPVLIGYVDAEQRYQFVNKTYEHWFGGTASEHLGRTLREIMGEEDYAQRKSDFDAALSGKVVNVERRTRSRLRELYAQFSLLPHRGADGGVRGFYVLAYDVTERKKAEEKLARERDLLLAVVDSQPDHIYVKGPDSRYVLINAVGRSVRGVASNDEVVGKSVFDFFPPQLAAQFDAEDQAVMATGIPLVNREQHIIGANGEHTWHLTNKVPLRDAAGQTMGLIGINHDITERRRAEEQVRIAASALENTAEGVMICDAERRIVSVNRAFTQITGFASEEAVGRHPEFMRSEKHDDEFHAQIWREVAETGRWQGEIWRRRKDGEGYPEWRSISAVKDRDGGTTHYVMVFTDISRIKEDEARLAFLAHHDPLTRLPNRLLFRDRCQEALARARRHRTQVGLLFIDLDHFKRINDSLGHEVGDLLLRAVATRLQDCVRASDTVARFGGDEFIVLLDELREGQDAAKVCEQLLAALIRPFELNGRDQFIAASIGISCYPSDGNDVQTLLKNADAAMYQAKTSGRNTYQFFEPETNPRALKMLTMTNHLRGALERGELLVHYQPVIDLASGRLIALEALARWSSPELGMVPPGQFIPLAEDAGLIGAIGEWVLRAACVQMAAWEAAGVAPSRVAVNVSSRQFQQKDFAERVAVILAETGLAPARLELEITESTMMRDPVQAEHAIRALHDLGLRLAIDDFGTGYSSLSYLKRFPIDTLKIDQSFIRDIPQDEEDTAITRAVIALAKSLGLSVIAEGVETEEQKAFLIAEKCDEAQGYLFAKPAAAAAVETLLREHARLAPTRGA